MSQHDLLVALGVVVDALGAIGVPYSVVGSVASSAYGIARSTVDADVVADLRTEHAAPLVSRLEATCYVDLDAVRDAIARRAMFNAIHLATMMKVDVYVLAARAFDRESFARRVLRPLHDEPDAPVLHVDTAEDVVLHKLEWYRAGGEVSERQWTDIVGVLEVQGPILDRDYLDRWAAILGVADLLARAFAATLA